MKDTARPSALMLLSILFACVFVVSCEHNDDDGSGEALVISPSSVTFNATNINTVLFTATGGTAPYTWSVDDTSLGTVVGAGGTAIYTSIAIVGQTFVVVTDAATNAVSAVVAQN